MAKLTVTEEHTLGAAEARTRVSVFEEMLSKFGVKLKWAGNTSSFKGVGVSGTLSVTDTSATVELKLGMMARAAGIDADRLKGSISRRLREAFDAE